MLIGPSRRENAVSGGAAEILLSDLVQVKGPETLTPTPSSIIHTHLRQETYCRPFCCEASALTAVPPLRDLKTSSRNVQRLLIVNMIFFSWEAYFNTIITIISLSSDELHFVLFDLFKNNVEISANFLNPT